VESAIPPLTRAAPSRRSVASCSRGPGRARGGGLTAPLGGRPPRSTRPAAAAAAIASPATRFSSGSSISIVRPEAPKSAPATPAFVTRDLAGDPLSSSPLTVRRGASEGAPPTGATGMGLARMQRGQERRSGESAGGRGEGGAGEPRRCGATATLVQRSRRRIPELLAKQGGSCSSRLSAGPRQATRAGELLVAGSRFPQSARDHRPSTGMSHVAALQSCPGPPTVRARDHRPSD
jgi:hypothetical protein